VIHTSSLSRAGDEVAIGAERRVAALPPDALRDLGKR
jgi:hypothetical protein